MTLNGYFTLNSVFVTLQFKIYLFIYTDSVVMIYMDEESVLAGQLVSGHHGSTGHSEKAVTIWSRAVERLILIAGLIILIVNALINASIRQV